MSRVLARLSLPALAIAILGVSACAPLRGHEGYVIDADLVNSIQPGVDNRQSVRQTLGEPTITGQFGGGDWYYVARDTRYLAYNNPKVKAQTTLRIRFDAAGVVQGVDRTGLEQVVSIDPSGDKTPTLGRQRSFFDELFGNIGTVGAGGPGSGAGGGGRGDEP